MCYLFLQYHTQKNVHMYLKVIHIDVYRKISSPTMREIKWNKYRYMLISWKSYEVENIKHEL